MDTLTVGLVCGRLEDRDVIGVDHHRHAVSQIEPPRQPDRRATGQARVDRERRQVGPGWGGMKAIRAVEGEGWFAPPGGEPSLARGQEQAPDVTRGQAVRLGDHREHGPPPTLRPHHVECGRPSRLPNHRVEACRPLAEVGPSLGQRRRPLLQHDVTSNSNPRCGPGSCGSSGPRG
jgi:hypothetical protein